ALAGRSAPWDGRRNRAARQRFAPVKPWRRLIMVKEPQSNSTQLRDDIDRGRTGDKVPGVEPAAAPLGADEEAGGAGPTAAEIAQARRAEQRPGLDSHRPNAAEPALAPDG